MHWLDLYYIVIPRPAGHAHDASPLHVSDVALLIGLGGVFVFALLRMLSKHTLIPERDPRLHESLAFENV
jgi:hypothetical protein